MSKKENFKHYIRTTKFYFFGFIILTFLTSYLSKPIKINSPEILIIIPDEYTFYAHKGFNNTTEKPFADYYYSFHEKVLSNNKTKFERIFNIELKWPGYYEISSFNLPDKVYFYEGKKITRLLDILTFVGIFGTVTSFFIFFIISWIEVNL